MAGRERHGGGGGEDGRSGVSLGQVGLPLLKRGDKRIDLKFDVLAGRDQTAGHVGVAQMSFAGDFPPIRRFYQHENAGISQRAKFHRCLHEDGSKRHLHALKLRDKIQQIAGRSHGLSLDASLLFLSNN